MEILGPHGLAVELRNRNWVDDDRREPTLDWFADRGVAFVGVDAPPGDNFQIMPPIDAVTNPSIAYLRAHGRNTEGYLTGKSVAERFAWQYTDEELEEIAERARGMAEQRRRGARGVQQQPRRRRAHGGAALPLATRSGAA